MKRDPDKPETCVSAAGPPACIRIRIHPLGLHSTSPFLISPFVSIRLRLSFHIIRDKYAYISWLLSVYVSLKMVWIGRGCSRVHVSKQDRRQGRDLKHEGKTERDQQRNVGTTPGPTQVRRRLRGMSMFNREQSQKRCGNEVVVTLDWVTLPKKMKHFLVDRPYLGK